MVPTIFEKVPRIFPKRTIQVKDGQSSYFLEANINTWSYLTKKTSRWNPNMEAWKMTKQTRNALVVVVEVEVALLPIYPDSLHSDKQI